MILALIALFYVLSARALSNYGEGKKIGKYGSFFTSIFLTPIIGFFITRRSRDLNINEIIKNEIEKEIRRVDGNFKINITDMVTTLITLNFVVFLLELYFFKRPFLITDMCLNFKNIQLYQFITHQFVHGGVSHLYSNMLFLILFGGSVEKYLGGVIFIISYLICGVVGSLTEIYFMKPDAMAGASAAVFGVMAIFALVSNDYFKIYKLRFKLSHIVWVFICSELYTTFQFRNDGVGHFAHTGGILCGIIIFILTKKLAVIKNN